MGFDEAIRDGVIGFRVAVGAAAETGGFLGDGVFDIVGRQQVGGVATGAGAVGV